MSDSDDDYMSDKLLQNCTEDIRPGLVHNRTVKRQHQLERKKQDIQAKKPKNKHELEKELREKGLNTALSTDNKGFQMLAKMGFKEGEGLGKSKSGRVEPIKIEVRSGKSGIGVETHIREKIKERYVKKSENLVQKMNDFQSSIRMKQAQRFLHKDFVTAQKACEDLDMRNEVKGPVEDFFWTRDTIKKRRLLEDEEEEEQFDEEFDSFFTEENLNEVVLYLREKHLYCIFCAFVATDEADLKASCPGPYRSDHDDG